MLLKKIDDFKASRGWLVKWMARHNLCYRRITSSGRNLPKDFVEKIIGHLNSVQKKAIHYATDAILGFDESSFYMDSIGNYSIEIKGSKICNKKSRAKQKI